MEIIINKCYGEFGLSEKAIKRLAEIGLEEAKKIVAEGWEMEGLDSYSLNETERNNPLLVQVVKELGQAANGAHAKLKVVDIPEGTEWEIEEYVGKEWVSEVHKTWS